MACGIQVLRPVTRLEPGGRSESELLENRKPQASRNSHWSEVSQRFTFQHQDPALPNCLQTPLLETSGQTTSKIGTQSHPSNKQTKKEMTKKNVKNEGEGKKLQDLVNEEEIGSLSEKEFRVMLVKKFQNIEKGIEKMQETFNTFNKDLEEIKNKQTVTNNTITGIKNSLQGMNSRITEIEEWTSDWKTE